MRTAGYDYTLSDRARAVYTSVTGRPVRRRAPSSYQEINGHKEVLLDLGFLAKREIPFGVNSVAAMAAVDRLESRKAIEAYVSAELLRTTDSTNYVTVVLVAPVRELPEWEALIRRDPMSQGRK
jgi:hypothetical protein